MTSSASFDVTPPESPLKRPMQPPTPPSPLANTNSDTKPPSPVLNDTPCVTQLNGIGVKGLKVPETAADLVASNGKTCPSTSGEAIGRVPDGTVFSVPETHDFIKTLFSPNHPKTLPELLTLGAMGTATCLFFFTNTPREVFLAMFIFWRCMYNIGLGVLLRTQSKDRGLVRMAKKIGMGSNPAEPRKKWVQFLVDQITRKMSNNGQVYDYESMPIEFNTWILYRGLVDVILVNDFTCYVCFAVSYYVSPEGGYGWTDALRYIGGISMLLFNLWVKTDAHRVVKDFAWYWGDFFFLVDASLTFDGVFEMAPHPMYSVGYIGFYGTALIAQSYWVLFVSLAAHAMQMVFLHLVENPHIDKTYNPPTQKNGGESTGNPLSKYFGRDLIVFQNLDWFRSTDLQTVVIAAYTVITALLIGSIDASWKFWFYVGQTLFWRVVHTYGLGSILYLQSNHKTWSRHFIKHGETPNEAFQHWKVIYNTTQLMSYVSFVICAVRLFVAPESILYGTFLLRATLGALFVLLHSWIAISIYEVIGSSGWFYGDFFIDELRYRSGPVYSGLYRYLDNPLLYTFSCWGMAMVCGSPALYAITFFGQVSNWFFLRYVEEPHMRRMYGSQIRQGAGVERVIKSKVGELERGAIGAVEKLAKDLDLVEVLNRIKDVKRTGEKELRKVMGPEAWKEFVDRARGRKAARGLSLHMTPPESEEDGETSGPDLTRPGLRLRRKISASSEYSNSSQDDGSGVEKNAFVMPTRARRDATKNLPLAVERIIEELEELVDQARPRMRAMVGETALKLVQMGENRSALVPVDLYSLRFPDCAPDAPATFRLGQPIVLEFTAATDTMTARDWIGLYPATANPNDALTTTQSQNRWLFITGDAKEDWESEHGKALLVTSTDSNGEKTNHVGQVQVTLSTVTTVSTNKTPGGPYSTVTGRLTFDGARLPWQVGVYEARYHYEGGHEVIAMSRIFEIVADVYDWTAAEDESGEVTRVLRSIVEGCADIDVSAGEPPLAVTDEILSRVKVDNCLDVSSYDRYKEEVARRAMYSIKQTFGIEFSWKVLAIDGTTAQLAKRICSARTALQPREYEQ
ncbi:phosphatidylethanolamine N-methyltransferase [Thoreauomyces humboldtii]|nr:phosphatidylethanolamine N-methyltransferase [Thoreauomyces humboldtii]